MLGSALGALLGRSPRKPAVMALQAVALLVIRQRNAAILALDARAAGTADHEPGISAAIDKDQRLRALGEPRGDGFAELRGKRADFVRDAEILAEIHNLHGRER